MINAAMLSRRPHYDHRKHAGNAGDLWKHFILAEVADYLLSEEKIFSYAESHVGFPRYNLGRLGEWEGGIGRCWPCISVLKVFPYFRVISEINSHELACYPGSTDLVLKIAKRQGINIDVDVWDIDKEVAASWNGDPRANFHLEDGFTAVQSILDRTLPGMILIDPPYIDENDRIQAANLLRSAEKAGWVVLWWQMAEEETVPEARLRKYTLKFSDINLSCGRWQGATMAIVGSDAHLIKHLDTQIHRFLDLAHTVKSF